jgi:DNA adenine methylase
MEQEFRPVAPVRPAAAYIGGKKRLAEHIARAIEAIPHETYAEPFVGMGGVFLRRSRAPRCEVINDISRDVATFFRILQRHYPQFMETLKFQIASRREFERLMDTYPDTLTDLERAGRFLYLQRLAFGGKVAGRNFGVNNQQGGRFDVTRLGPILEAIHERLAGVTIECLPWAEFIARWDGPQVLFYLDPPYYGSEDDYGAGRFSRYEFDKIADALEQIEGRFLLSLNDTPETRKIFGRFGVETVETKYTISRGEASDVKEILVFGPDPALLDLAKRKGDLFGA